MLKMVGSQICEAQKSAALVDVVIVTYDAAAVISSCLAGLQASTDQVRVLVADNASQDNTVTLARRAEVEVLEMHSNAGFGAACNAGAAIGQAPIILFLNPDAEVHSSDVLLAAEAMDELGASVLGVRLVQSDGSFDHAAKRMLVRPTDALKFLVRRDPSSQYLAPGVGEFETGEVDSVNGAFLMIRRHAFESIGGYDERFWMYLEDVDLCLRAKDQCGPVLYWPGVTALHRKSAITGRSRSPRLNYHFHRSMWIFYRKHQAGDDQYVTRAVVFLGVLARGAWVTARDLYRRHRGVGLPYSSGRNQ